MAGKRAQSPVGGVPQTRRTQAADAPETPAVSGARGLPGVSQRRARRVKDDSAGSGRSRLPVGARAPQKFPVTHPDLYPGPGLREAGPGLGAAAGEAAGKPGSSGAPGFPDFLPPPARPRLPLQRVGVRVGRR